MRRNLLVLVLALSLLILAVPVSADPGMPNFGAAVWGDGQLWGTKATTELPVPNEHNLDAYDGLYVVTNSNHPGGQLAVAEAAPTNPTYNGGRWFTYTVTWTQAAFDGLGTVPVLTSYTDIMHFADLGYLTVTAGPPPGGPPPAFQCPLLPMH